MNSIFIGNKSKPTFLVEIIPKKKQISIYKPDKYSKNEEFYEKYSLGKLLIKTKYNEIIFEKKPVPYKDFLYVPKLIIKIKNNYLYVSKTLKLK
jgi:hypothetical protein